MELIGEAGTPKEIRGSKKSNKKNKRKQEDKRRGIMDYVYAFLIGGAICVIGQILMDATKLTAPRVLVILVTAGALLQAFHLYQPLVDLAATGARIPLPGFGYNLAKGAMEGAASGLLGAVTGGVKAAAGGITVAIGWGYLIALVFSPKSVR